jgi:hypothetical protein
MVRRSVAIALGIVCIILVVVSLVGAFAYYTPIIDGKDNTISSLNSQIASLNTQVSDQNYTISSLNTQLAILQNETKNIHIQGAENSTIFVYNWTTDLDSSVPIRAASQFYNVSQDTFWLRFRQTITQHMLGSSYL